MKEGLNMKKFITFSLFFCLMSILVACQNEQKSLIAEEETQTVDYLGETYKVPKKIEKIVITGAMEAMEDATVLNVEPVGAVTVAGEFPEIYKSITAQTVSIGEKQQPNFEKILELQPDLILGTTKFPAEVVTKLEEIAPTILISHISDNWENNLRLLAHLTENTNEVNELLEEHAERIDELNKKLSGKFKDSTTLIVRVRGGQMFVYPENVFFNPSLYEELQLTTPSIIKAAKAQEAITLEQLAEINPDYLFVQVQETGTDQNENVQFYGAMKENPIFQNITAYQQGHVYENIVDSLLEGGTLLSKSKFLTALEQLNL